MGGGKPKDNWEFVGLIMKRCEVFVLAWSPTWVVLTL